MHEQETLDLRNMDIHPNFFLKKKIILFLIIFAIGIALRFYNLNFEDFWYDEIASFWVADPNLSSVETALRSKNLDNGTNIIFSLILKKYFNFFGYNSNIARILTVIFGTLSILSLSYLNYQTKKNNSFILLVFLASINWYLISYSQELRAYSLLFLLSTLSIIFYFKIIFNNSSLKISIINHLLYISISIFAASIHIFFFIIVFSQIIFLLISYSEHKTRNLVNLISTFLIPIIYIMIMFDSLLLQLSIKDFWIQQIKIGFFADFFFSRFFGSKIMGLIYLVILIMLIIAKGREVFKRRSKLLFLFLVLFFSYFLPLIYSLFNQPILIDRYIIFVLIPILILISSLLIEIKNKKFRLILLIVLVISSISNNYIEIFNRKISKPEFKKIINFISNSKDKNIVVNTDNKQNKEMITNYMKNINDDKKITFLSSNETYIDVNNVWLICYKPVNNFDCENKNKKILKWANEIEINFHLVQATLYKNIKN